MTAEERLAKRLGLKVTVNPRFEGGMVVERDEDIFYASDEEVAMYEELLRLEREREWIKVSERLPEPRVNVLIWREDNQSSYIAYWSGDLKGWIVNSDMIWWKVEYWRPLPAAPEEE